MEKERTFPDDFPTDGVELSYFLVVNDYARALAFYRDVLGAAVVRELPGTLCLPPLSGQPDSAVSFGWSHERQAYQPEQRIDELTMRVPDCSAAYEVLRSRGAEFITPPVDWGDEIRAFFHDPDGHLLEISETREASERGW